MSFNGSLNEVVDPKMVDEIGRDLTTMYVVRQAGKTRHIIEAHMSATSQ